MKRIAAVALLALAGCHARLPVPTDNPAADLPTPPRTSHVRVSGIYTGEGKSKAIFGYRGGSLLKAYHPTMVAILVEHPDGTFLFDASFGSNVKEHLSAIPKLMRLTTPYHGTTCAAEQLKDEGIDPDTLMGVYLSHSHWDHVSGLEDLPGVTAYVPSAELDYIATLPDGELVKRLEPKLTLEAYDLDSGPFWTFESSKDIFGDGSVVLVPLPGHTPGSVGLFVFLDSGKSYLFIGDLAWMHEGVERPSERPGISRNMVDVDRHRVRANLVRVHELMQAMPDLIVVPAHDVNFDEIARFPERTD